MNSNLDLDRAIDRVASRLTHVDDDPQLVSRIVASLPERSTWFAWLTHSWAPRLAMAAIIAAAATFWSQRHVTEVAPASQPIAGVQQIQPQQFVASVAPRNATVEPGTAGTPGILGIKPLEFLEPVGPVEPFIGLESLAVNSVAPEALPDAGALTVPSLVIADLPLTAESFSERE